MPSAIQVRSARKNRCPSWPAALQLATALAFGTSAAHAAIINVPGDQPTIQAAITAAVNGDVIVVAAGAYSENLQLNKSVTLQGPQAGVNACGRVAAEAVVSAANPAVEALQIIGLGAANAVIDGFTFRGTTTAFACIQSIGNATDGMRFLNNRVREFVTVGMYLNKGDINGVINGNEFDGSSQVGSGSLIQLDGPDLFHGLQFTNNCLINTPATGLSDISTGHNWTASGGASQPPAITGNTFNNCGTGANIGAAAFNSTTDATATISNNVFKNSVFDGLQGGPQNTTISGNTFQNNGRTGLALTSFSSTNISRGAQNCTITGNTFTGNVSEGIFYSAAQAAGTISTNIANNNDFLGTTVAARYAGTETINVKCNWWNDIGGPNYLPNNTNAAGAQIVSPTVMQYVSWLNGPIATSPLCNQPPPTGTARPTWGHLKAIYR